VLPGKQNFAHIRVLALERQGKEMMREMGVHFRAVHQTGQHFGWSGIYTTAMVVGRITLPSGAPCAFAVAVSETDSVREGAKLEIGPLSGYGGLLSHAAFRLAVERFYWATRATLGGRIRDAYDPNGPSERDFVRRVLVVDIPMPANG
jgi:hypothetical protein